MDAGTPSRSSSGRPSPARRARWPPSPRAPPDSASDRTDRTRPRRAAQVRQRERPDRDGQRLERRRLAVARGFAGEDARHVGFDRYRGHGVAAAGLQDADPHERASGVGIGIRRLVAATLNQATRNPRTRRRDRHSEAEAQRALTRRARGTAGCRSTSAAGSRSADGRRRAATGVTFGRASANCSTVR